jgi:hypothetical protein
VEKHQVLTPEELAAFNEESSDDVPVWILIPFLGMFVSIGAFLFGAGISTKTGFPLVFGSFFGGTPLLMALAILPSVTAMTLLPLSLAMSALGYRLGKRPSWRDAFRDSGKGKGGGGSSSGSGWVMGGSSGGSSGSSSSSSSSSFGGGSSGGGGASGRW